MSAKGVMECRRSVGIQTANPDPPVQLVRRSQAATFWIPLIVRDIRPRMPSSLEMELGLPVMIAVIISGDRDE